MNNTNFMNLKNFINFTNTKKGCLSTPSFYLQNGNYSWPSNSAPGLNFTTFFAGI